jgi:hypothetical protein
MRNYSQAQKYAEMALENGPNTIIDYNTITVANPLPKYLASSEVIYGRISASVGAQYVPTQAFLLSFDQNDLRLKLYYTGLGNYSFPRGTTTFISYGNGYANYQSWGPTVAEMRLIVAECTARANDLPTALQQLDDVRKNRIAKSAYQPYQSAVQQDVLQQVLSERTFEFAYTGMRWFDMRRLNAEGLMTTVNRYDANNKVIASLAPNSPRYTLQIPLQVMFYHNNWTQNP